MIAEGSLEDDIRKRARIHIGPEGMAIDRKTYQDRWQELVQQISQKDQVVRRIPAGETAPAQ